MGWENTVNGSLAYTGRYRCVFLSQTRLTVHPVKKWGNGDIIIQLLDGRKQNQGFGLFRPAEKAFVTLTFHHWKKMEKAQDVTRTQLFEVTW